MSQRHERTFAFGCDVYDNRPCPARAAGFTPDTGDESTEPAERFDERIRSQTGLDEGVVSENVARDTWKGVIRTLEGAAEADDYYQEALEAARMVADELGWL